MKVLLIHNFYTLSGGEDAVFRQEAELLSSKFEVSTLTFRNKEGILGGIQFLLSIYNIFIIQKVNKKIRDFAPDLIHIHNFHFAAGPILIRIAKKKKIPLIITLHNYRLLCPSTTMTDGDFVYTNSLNKTFPLEAVVKGLYRESRMLTFWLVLVTWFHYKLGTWGMVDRYLALTSFSKNLFSSNVIGINPNTILIKPNFVLDYEGKQPLRLKHFLFVGRLSGEKGIRTLLKSFSKSKLILKVAGKGPLESEFLKQSQQNSNIISLGALGPSDVRTEMLTCSALIFPSVWFEGMPMTILEAFSTGTPVIASNLGNMADMIIDGYNGLLFKAGDTNDLISKVSYWNSLSTSTQNEFSLHARMTYEKEFTPDRNLQMLCNIYDSLYTADA